jgi:hypothetical protein
MEPIGVGALRVVAHAKEGASQVSRLHALALPAKKESDGLPIRFDRDVDMEIPRRVICWWPNTGPLELRREMRPDERAMVEARSAALELALQPFHFDQITEVEASIGAMFAGFRSMRQQGEAVEDVVAITRAVLREFPLWAITKGCLKIARHEIRGDPRWAPNDAEIVDVVYDLVKPYHEALDGTKKLLAAVVQAETRMPTRGSVREPHQSSPPEPSDGKHAARVAAGLAARKASRSVEP